MYKYFYIRLDKVCLIRCEFKCECFVFFICFFVLLVDCVIINRNKIIDNMECLFGCIYQCCKKEVKCFKLDLVNLYCVFIYIQYKIINGKKCLISCFCVFDVLVVIFKK